MSQNFKRLKSILREHNTIDALETLVASGCDENVLSAILDLIHRDWPGLDASLKKTGLSRKQLKAAIGRFLAVADTIEQINRKSSGLLLLHGSGFDYLRNLPNALRIYAAFLEQPFRGLGRVRSPVLHAWKFYLTQHVIEHTKEPHDEEVAALIDAVLPEGKRTKDRKHGGAKTYDAIAQKEWRLEHYKRTAEILGNARKPAYK